MSPQKDRDELYQFCLANLHGHRWTPHLIKQFLSELTSSPDLIFDLHDKSGRLAVAVLLDRVRNPTNDACLEILGMRPDVDLRVLTHRLLEMAKNKIPTNRSGFQIGWEEPLAFSEVELAAYGLQHHFDTYDLHRENLAFLPLATANINLTHKQMIHMARTLIERPDDHPFMTLGLAFGLVALASTVLHFAVERPGLLLRDRLLGRFKERAIASGTAAQSVSVL